MTNRVSGKLELADSMMDSLTSLTFIFLMFALTSKTVEVLGLIMATLPELKREVEIVAERKAKTAYNYDDENYYSAESSDGEDDGEYLTHTTLIIVPPALVAQWLHEIEKAVGKTTLTVSMVVANTGELKKCLPVPAPDRVVTPDDDEDDWDLVQASDIVICTYDCLSKKTCSTLLQTVQWGRVVLDEMQEIRSSTTEIAKNCETLQCDRRWMVCCLFDLLSALCLALISNCCNFLFFVLAEWDSHFPRDPGS